MKRKKLFASIATFCLSIALMMFGVYAAASPNVKLSGQVNYSVYDAKILALGRVENAKTLDGSADVNAATYPTVNADYKTSTKVNTPSQYLDYTTGADKNDSNDNFSTWAFGDLSFNESNVNPIKFYLNFTNFSLYDVVATITFESSEEDLASNNLTRNVSETEVIIAGYNQTATSKEILIEYDVINRGAKVNKFNVNASITIEQYFDEGGNGGGSETSKPETLEGWTYSDNTDGTITLTAYNGSETELVIPSVLDGKVVTTLGNQLFVDNSVINYIKVSDSVTTIEDEVFANTNINITIIFGENVSSIGANCFANDGQSSYDLVFISKSIVPSFGIDEGMAPINVYAEDELLSSYQSNMNSSMPFHNLRFYDISNFTGII